ncbi:MAG TPA: hypothetical protein VGF77_02620 [Allosphingosinicella sp.]|jgi:hypothetical protein
MATILAASPVRAGPGEHHWSPNIDYLTCNNTEWSAIWDGNGFLHTPHNHMRGAKHRDSVIVYKTWDGSCWRASWDAAAAKFKHEPIDAHGNVGPTHEDIVLNYIHWSKAKWTALRDDNGFLHILVAEPDGGGIFGGIKDFVLKNGAKVSVTIPFPSGDHR